MGLFRRKTTARPGGSPAGTRRGAVSVSVSGQSSASSAYRKQKVAEPAVAAPAAPVVERFEGTTIEPAATAALRISSAADVDPNVKKYGDGGVFKGGAGGYGGAGTK